MKKKLVSMLLAATMVMTLLVGCGGASAETNTAGSNDAATETNEKAGADAGENKLSVYAWDANFNIPALKAAEADYKENVDSSFSLEIIEQANSQDVEGAVTLAGSAKDYSTLPDIVLFQDHYIQRYVADYPDAWVSIDDAGVNWDDFGAEKVSYSTVGGKHYGFPVDNGTAIFAYRVDLLEQCGYTIDDMKGITWEKFIQVGEEIYNKTGKYLLSMDGSGNDLIYMMLQCEGQSQFKDGKINITENQTVVDIIQVIVEMCQKNVLYLANDWGDYTDQTIMGDMVAGVMNGNWIIPTIQQVKENSGKWEITTCPTLNGGEGYAANGGSSLYITANCKNPDLAKKFLAYTFGGSSKTYDAALKDGGVITTCISAGKSEVYNEGVEFFNNTPIYSQIVEMGSHVKIIEQNDFHYTVREKLGNAIVKAKDGEDLMTCLKQAEEEINFEMGY